MIKTLKVADLRRHEPTPSRATATTAEVVRLSINEFGLLKPPTVNSRTGRVIDLWSVVEACRREGKEELECWMVELDEAQEAAAVLMLNSRLNDWDWEHVSTDLKRVQAAGLKLELTGLKDSDTGPLLAADWKQVAKVALDDLKADAQQVGLFG